MSKALGSAFLFALVAISVATSCRTTSKPEIAPGSVTPRASLGLSSNERDARKQVSKDWFRPEPVIPVLIESGESRVEMARLMLASCQVPAGNSGAQPFLSRWEIDLDTFFGRRVLRFTVSRYGMKVLVRGFVGEESTEFISSSAVPDDWMAAACAGVSQITGAGTQAVIATAGVKEALKSWLAGFAPDCRSDFPAANESGKVAAWSCDIPAVQPGESALVLERTRQLMISGWTRQPYLLARRVAIGITLADALQNALTAGASIDASLERPCAVIKRSLRPELPLVLDDPGIVESLCGKQPDQLRAAIGAVIVAKIAAEVDALRKVFENTSKLGALTVSFPVATSEANGSPLLVTLRPDEDVVLGLARYTQALLMQRKEMRRDAFRRRASADLILPRNEGNSDAVVDPNTVLGYACWSPLFDASHERLLVAQELGLTASTGSCTGREGPGSSSSVDISWNPQRYVAESITSDTEFFVNSGETKTLRLPSGTYSYSVQVVRQVTSSPDDSATPAAPIAEGRIEWTLQRPKLVISESSSKQNSDRP